MKITILGSGTSTGVPIPICTCHVCTSDKEKDKRTRSSILVSTSSGCVVVDTGPDFRFQCLRYKINSLDAVLYTHHHYDHIGGLNDLRAYCLFGKKAIPVWCTTQTANHIQHSYPYVLNNQIPGQTSIQLNDYATENKKYVAFTFADIYIQPIQLFHDNESAFETIGFVFDKKVAYLTDFKKINSLYYPYLYELDVMILGSPVSYTHPTHICFEEALHLIEKFKPKQGYISHLGHEKTHQELTELFSKNTQPAYDGLILEI